MQKMQQTRPEKKLINKARKETDKEERKERT